LFTKQFLEHVQTFPTHEISLPEILELAQGFETRDDDGSTVMKAWVLDNKLSRDLKAEAALLSKAVEVFSQVWPVYSDDLNKIVQTELAK
jgi:hypothetical protein